MKQYFFRLTLLAAIVFQAMNVFAADVDAREALTRAATFLRSQSSKKMMSPGATLQLAHAEQSALDANKADFYVFNTTDGSAFVIVSGDDRAEAILGYGDGSIDMLDLPCNLQWMLNAYKEQIEWLHANPTAQVTVTEPYSDVTIAPMLTCTWSQSRPYYNQCPEYQGRRCVTGCIATAMAQVLYFWRYPETAPSLSAFTTRSLQIYVSSLPAKRIDWDNLIDSYAGNYTESQADAVAMLMRYCGQASRMDYSPDGSGATVWSQLQAVQRFSYNRAQMKDRSDYDSEDWNDILLQDLLAERPVLYSGNDGLAGGHAFVLDGYYRGKYHINWGWSGTGNGYFSLGAFNVEGYSFNAYHQIVHNIYPGSTTEPDTGYDFEENGIYYMFDEEGDALLVTYKDTQFNTYQGNVVIPESAVYEGEAYPVVGIANSAFRNCDNLSSVTIPGSVKTIDKYAFRNCIGLTDIVLPEGVTTIGSQAFANCLNLQSINIPSSLSDVSTLAFQDCLNLTRVNATSIESWLGINFDGHYANPLSYSHHIHVGGNEVTELVIPESIEAIKPYAFIECSGLTSLTLHSGTTQIGKAAFSYCSGLNDITLPSTLTDIDNQAFYACTGLTHIDIPSSVSRLKYASFAECSGLTSINIPETVTVFEDYAFQNCSQLPSITISDQVTAIGSNAFAGCTRLAGLVIPSSVTEIGSGAFSNCTSLTGIIIPNSVTELGANAFNGCSNLKNLVISESLTTINAGTFSDCSSLTRVVIPDGVTTILKNAFYRCTYLNDLTIGEHAEFIENKAFTNCPRLTKVTCLAKTPPTLENPDCFTREVYNKATLFVPKTSIDAYSKGGIWAWFKKIVGIGIQEDVNNDFEVNIADINAIIDAILTSGKKSNCDVNADGEININDINQVIDYIINHN